MAFSSLPRAILAICLCIVAVQRVSAQSVSPTNNTSNTANVTLFILDTVLGGMETKTNIKPLTPQAGMAGSLDQLEAINPKGPLVLTNTQNIGSLKKNSIAYISCEPADYAGGNIDSNKILSLAANIQPDAIILYSISAAQCTFDPSNDFSYNSIYTMLTASLAESVLTGLAKNNPPSPTTSINVNSSTVQGSNGSGNGNGSGGNVLEKSPTTAVAMIILYSITGIITALFLLIIIVGAIRAHRHPERYGPRRVLGRPRQSRAKGIARAMLETLPIVKFGDHEEDKTVEPRAESDRDVELAEHPHNNNGPEPQPATDHASASSAEGAAPAEGPDVVTTEAHGGTASSEEIVADTADKTDQGLACSVCVEDFEKGQDLRVLPCKHRFHPECIDPWLLNVSGTCPLCRVELQPASSRDQDAGAEEEYTEVPLASDATLESWPQPETPNADSARRNRRSRILHTLNHGRMRHATPEERIAALRRLRRENQTSDSIPEQGSRTGNRFSRRFSHALGGSRPASRPISEVPPSATASTFPAGETAASPTASTFNHTVTRPSSPATGTFSRRMSRAFGGSRPVSRPISEVTPSATAATFPATAEAESSAAEASSNRSHLTQPIAATAPAGTAADSPSSDTGSTAPHNAVASSSTTPISPAPANAAAPPGPPRTSWYNSFYRYRS